MKKITLITLLIMFSIQFGNSQVIKNFETTSSFVGYMSWTGPSGDNTGGQGWGVADLVAVVDAPGEIVTLKPNRVNNLDPYWQTVPAGVLGEKIMTASIFVQDETLGSTNFNFEGNISSYTLDSQWSVQAFIKVFAAGFSSLLVETYLPVSAAGDFLVNYDGTAGGAIVQYGFVTVGPNVNPEATYDAQYDAFGGVVVGLTPGAPPVSSFSDDFEDGTVGDYNVGTDGGTLTVIDNPDATTRSSSSVLDNTSAKVAQLAGINTGLYTHIEKTISDGIDLSSGDRGFSMQVKGASSIPIKFKVEGGTAAEVDVTYTDVNNWQNLVFDFTGITNAGNNKIVVFFDFENATTPGPDFLFDDIKMAAASTLGTTNFELIDLNVYPNPSNNVWNIKAQQTIDNIQVFDVLGKQVMNVKPNDSEVELDASTLPKGLYFAKMTTDLGSNSIKLIKN
jgi:hypothetical protein